MQQHRLYQRLHQCVGSSLSLWCRSCLEAVICFCAAVCVCLYASRKNSSQFSGCRFGDIIPNRIIAFVFLGFTCSDCIWFCDLWLCGWVKNKAKRARGFDSMHSMPPLNILLAELASRPPSSSYLLRIICAERVAFVRLSGRHVRVIITTTSSSSSSAKIQQKHIEKNGPILK